MEDVSFKMMGHWLEVIWTFILKWSYGQKLTYKFVKFWAYRIVSNKRPGGVAIFQKGDVYKRPVFNAKMQWLSLFTMTRHREI